MDSPDQEYSVDQIQQALSAAGPTTAPAPSEAAPAQASALSSSPEPASAPAAQEYDPADIAKAVQAPQEFDLIDLKKAKADALENPEIDLPFDQWKESRDAANDLGYNSIGHQVYGMVGGLFQTAWGALKELGKYAGDAFDSGDMAINSGAKTPAPDAPNASLVNTGLEGVRQLVLNTEENTQKVGQFIKSIGAKESPDQADQRDYQNYLDNQVFNREIAQPTITSIKQVPIANQLGDPMPNTATALAIGLAPENLVAEAAGGAVGALGLNNLAKAATGRVFQTLGNGVIKVDDGIQAVADAAQRRVQEVTGMTPEMQDKVTGKILDLGGAAGVAGAGVLGYQETHKEDGSGSQFGHILWNMAKPALGYVFLRNRAATLRTVGQGAQLAGTIFREAADPMGPMRADALQAIASNPDIPQAYRDAIGNNASGIDSTPSRIANSSDFPKWVRVFADKLSNPAIVQASRLAGSAAEGAVGGAVSSIPFTAEADNSGQGGAMMAMGGIFGAAGGLANRVIGSDMAERNADIARFLADTALVGGDPVKAANLPPDRLADLAALQGLISLKGGEVMAGNADQFNAKVAEARAPGQPAVAGTEVVPLPATDFEANRAALGGGGASGWYFDAQPGQKPRLFINLDAENPADTHEFAHAILGSQVMDGGVRANARNFIQQLYGDNVPKMAREYAQRSVEAQNNDLTQRAVDAGQPVPDFGDLQTQIDDEMQRLTNKGLAAGDADPLDWARDEIFAEHLNQAGINVNDVRRGLNPTVDPEGQAQGILNAQARVLGAAGAPIDPVTGAVTQPMSKIFRDNPLIGSSPELSLQLAKYVQSYGDWLNGINGPAKAPKGVVLASSGNPYELAKSQGVILRPVPGQPGVLENGFLRNDNGTITIKSQKEIDDAAKLRADQARLAVGSTIRPASDPVLGRRADGTITGTALPDNTDSWKHFGPWMQSVLRTFRQSEGTGQIWNTMHHPIGSGETGSYKIKNLGNLRAETFEHSQPFRYDITSKGNITAHVVDITNLRKKVLQGINEGRFPYHNNNAADIEASMKQYLENFRQRLPSENGIGAGKRDEINSLMFTGSKVHRLANPLASDFGPQGMIRQIRIDRIENLKPSVDTDPRTGISTPKTWFHFDSDAYQKVNNNMMPDVGGNKSGPMYAPEVGPKSGFSPSLSAVDLA